MTFSNPQKNLDQLGITEGMHVADLGCGSGFYTLAAARSVGSDGKVYAVDLQRDLLSRIKHEVEEEGIEHVEVVWGDIEKPGGTQLGDGSVDVVIVSNVLFQAHDINAVLREAFRIVHPGGRALVVEWRDSFGGLGPQEGDIVSEQTTRSALEAEGFAIIEDINAGKHHYGIVARKPKNESRTK